MSNEMRKWLRYGLAKEKGQYSSYRREDKMKATLLLIICTVFWIVSPAISEADGRDRHDRSYEKQRDQQVYQQTKRHDRGHQQVKVAQKRHRPGQYWNQHRRTNRHVAYRPARQRVVYRQPAARVIHRQPAILSPLSALIIGVPNLTFHISW